MEVVQKLDKRDKSKLNEDFNQPVEEFVPHGSYTVSNSGGYEVMLNDAGDAARVRDAYGSDNPQTSDWLEIEYVPGEDGESEPVIDPEGYNIPLNQVMRLQEGDDKWIQKAVDPAHKGYCTPMTKDTCTPARKALAKRFKAGIEDESVNEAAAPQTEQFGQVSGTRMWKHMMDNLSDGFTEKLLSNAEDYQAFVKGVIWAIGEESSQFGADVFAKNAGAAPDEMVEAQENMADPTTKKWGHEIIQMLNYNNDQKVNNLFGQFAHQLKGKAPEEAARKFKGLTDYIIATVANDSVFSDNTAEHFTNMYLPNHLLKKI